MKKTVIALLALAGFVQADDTSAYVVKDSDFAYYPQDIEDNKTKIGMLALEEVATTFNTGTFAISFDVSKVLDSEMSFDFHFGYGVPGQGAYFAFSFAPNPLQGSGIINGEYILTFPNVNIFSAIGLDNAIDANRLIFQVTDLFGNTPTVSLFGYTEGEDELEVFWTKPVPGTVPPSIESANLRLCGVGDTYTPLEGISLTIWQGQVSASDMANPTPAPSVPEPTTATLSLLALAGLAARRRRK